MKTIIISGPSGSGKTTVLAELIKATGGKIEEVVSCTSREPRENEIDGVDYHFVTKKTFAKECFLEIDSYCGNFYGTRESDIQDILVKGSIPAMILTVNGKLAMEDELDAITFFIAPPSDEELYRRLHYRSTDSASKVVERMEAAKEEMKYADTFDHVIINDSLKQAVWEILEIINM